MKVEIRPDSLKSIDRWIMEAKVFAYEYSCVISLETFSDQDGESIEVELCDSSNEKRKFKFRGNILYPSRREIRRILLRLYHKLQIRQGKIDWTKYLEFNND